MIRTENISIRKTAKVALIGASDDNIEEVWLVVHGYGQLSNFFIQSFSTLASDKILIVAPEGLHRFYLEGMSGRVGASWMTKEERLVDVEDYLAYLDDVYKRYISVYGDSVKVRILGFSQGTSTICRWFMHTKNRVDTIILWSGMMPPDFIITPSHYQKWPNVYLIFDPEDPHFQQEHFQLQINWLTKNNLAYTTLQSSDGHRVSEQGLELLLNELK
jgi:predicted esterase